MSVEPRRGCGFRKIGGLYFVSQGTPVFCDRLPIPLDVCPTCGHGIKQTRGYTWIDIEKLVGGLHPNCADEFACPLCMRPDLVGRAGLLWIGAKYYKTPREFCAESDALGVSRRISAVPRGFKVGETWILLAHPHTIETWTDVESVVGLQGEFPVVALAKCLVYKPGIFRLWKPERIEKILPESWKLDPTHFDELQELAGKGITPVFVPDGDPDHRDAQTAFPEEEENGAE